MQVKRHQVAVGDDAVDGDVRLRVLAEEALEIAVEGLSPVGDVRIVLDVAVADVEAGGLGRLVLVEGQLVEGGDDAGVLRLGRGAVLGQGGRRAGQQGQGADQQGSPLGTPQ
jgi:hypothetical protein